MTFKTVETSNRLLTKENCVFETAEDKNFAEISFNKFFFVGKFNLTAHQLSVKR